MDQTTTQVRDKIVVRPVANSRRFAPVNATLNYEVEKNGRQEVVKSELYKGQRIPDSQQGLVIRWNDKRRSYLLDMKFLEAHGGLQKIVDKLGFTHRTGPKAGELITECNLSNRLDPFVVAMRESRPYMQEGEIVLYLDEPSHLFWAAALRANTDFSDNLEQIAGRNVVMVGTKYAMITESQEVAKKAEESNLKETAFKELMELRKRGDEDARKVGIICGAPIEVVNDSRTLYPYLVEYLDDAKTLSKIEPMFSQQQFFIQLVNKPKTELELLYLVTVAKSKGLIKYVQAPSGVPYYSFNRKNLGSNMEELFEFLQNGDNMDLYSEIVSAVRLTNV